MSCLFLFFRNSLLHWWTVNINEGHKDGRCGCKTLNWFGELKAIWILGNCWLCHIDLCRVSKGWQHDYFSVTLDMTRTSLESFTPKLWRCLSVTQWEWYVPSHLEQVFRLSSDGDVKLLRQWTNLGWGGTLLEVNTYGCSIWILDPESIRSGCWKIPATPPFPNFLSPNFPACYSDGFLNVGPGWKRGQPLCLQHQCLACGHIKEVFDDLPWGIGSGIILRLWWKLGLAATLSEVLSPSHYPVSAQYSLREISCYF